MKESAELNNLFVFQNIDSEEYKPLGKIIKDFPSNGILITVCKAYFFGMVVGKRRERSRCKNISNRLRI